MAKAHVAIVTGGAGDIGTAIAKQLSSTCQTVIALDCIEPQQTSKWQQQLEQDGFTNIIYEQIDVTDYNACENLANDLKNDHQSIDILVNAAGITRDSTLVKMEKDNWDAVLEVNLTGVFNLTKHIVPLMIANNYGRIINISSVNAQKGQFGQCNYSAAKAGMYGFTKSLAQEVIRKGITVNSISPGYVNTKMVQKIKDDVLDNIISEIPCGRLAEVDEIAWVVSFLASENSQYITGANIPVNGGLHYY
jgi:acetoacetyl-CoA reductase